jgi:2-polyprenyl-6-methoxyphenol hydroxylase-like FAD-dependent oxidoreductase
MIKTNVLIAGGGPAGLLLAIELGQRGIPCILAEEDAGPPMFPKANATTARTMEHYRRLGFSAEIRGLGMTEDYPQDISYFTRFTKHELARVPGRTRREAAKAREGAHSRWPTPEPLHRTQQMYIEPVLQRQAERCPSVTHRFGWRLVAFTSAADGVKATIENVTSGQREEISADYLCGCDGPRSIVRTTLGIQYQGWAGEERDFLGGKMLATYFRSPAFYDVVPFGKSWQYWATNRVRRGTTTAIDGKGLFVAMAQLPRGQEPTEAYGRESLFLTTGREFPLEIIASEPWTAGLTLVAERYADEHRRVFLVGDSAHLFTPTGGQGYNTAVDDAANLGWKLAAMCAGWGGPGLLGTYQTERKPIGERNTRFARAMADSIGHMAVPPEIEEDSPAGQTARERLGAQLRHHCIVEFDIPGIHFGMFYDGSPIIATDGTPPPKDDWSLYTPHATPGARAPHLWVDDNKSIFDRFGRGFTLVRMGTNPPEVRTFVDAAAALGVPLSVIDVGGEEARDIYGADLALIRPDHHVAWRGNAIGDTHATLARVTGRA